VALKLSVDVRKADEWVEIVKDVQEKSKGMAEISLNDDQTAVTIIGTDDIMTAWEKYGTLDIIEKDILKNHQFQL
jgi:predicted nuclease of restriction endonuclease-like RecB superfamily